MMQNILPPPTLQGDERAQLTQVYRYLFRLSEQLNVSLSALEGRTATMARPSGGARSPEGTDAEQFWADADAQYSSLKSLIIKTANLVRAEMDQIVTNLGSEYVAVSEWGAYKEEVSREIVDTAKYTLENFEYNEEILNIPEMAAIFDSYRIETTGYIKRGIIGFDDENYPILGIAIGQELKHKEVTVGGEVYEVFDESQNMATYAADKLSFWVNGVEVAYLSNRELVVTRIIVSDSIQLGNWDIAVNAADGMTVQKRIGSALDLSENNTINVTAEKINAVADQIDLSGNTSIVLTAEQVNAVADQINLSGNSSIELIVGPVEQAAADAQSAATAAQQTATAAQDSAESAVSTAESAQSAAESAQAAADSALPRAEFQRVVRIDDEGLHVGDNQSNGEVLLDSSSVNVVFNGQKYSKFSGNYVQFGNYQLRKSTDGGLVFKLA